MERSKISPLILAFTFAVGSGAGAPAKEAQEERAPGEQSSCHTPGAILRPDYPRISEVDYLRRAVRSDELLLVHTRDGLRRLVHSFLAELETAN